MHAMRQAIAATFLTAALSACVSEPVVIPATAAPPPADRAAAIAEFVALANDARRANGCGAPLVWHDGVASVAHAHSADMHRHGYFDHVGRDGSTPMQRVQAAGIAVRAVAENIALGQPTGRTVFESWRDSPGHRRNMLNCDYTHHGVGLDGAYWVHVLVGLQ